MPTANENEENITKYYFLPMVAEKLRKENYVERIRTSQSSHNHGIVSLKMEAYTQN